MEMTIEAGGEGRTERGSILIIAVIAMLTLGVLGLSLALLARVEVDASTGLLQRARAEALAEGALAHALDVVRPGVVADGGFTRWLGSVVVDGVRLGGGEYWARIDDDCAPAVPAALEQVGCPSSGDTNGLAVVTAWGRAGAGRARVRAMVVLDRPWAHVCAAARSDPDGDCGGPGPATGPLAVTPSDPNDANGPATYAALPAPVLGCSRIDPGLHGAPGGCPAGSRLVLTGEDPGTVPGAAVCREDPGGGRYFGYFDCALQTPCEPAAACPAGATRGCVRPGDTRLTSEPARYREPGPSGCASLYPASVTGDPSPATGLVFNHAGGPAAARNPSFASLGSPGRGVTAYVLRQGGDGQVELRAGAVYGTLVVEGNGVPSAGDGCSSGNTDVRLGDDVLLRAEPGAYGYPLALVIYDPAQSAPTVTPPAPQSVCARVGTRNTTVEGAVYSAGQVRLGSVAMNGSVVGFEIRIEGVEGRLSYDPRIGDATPPGFRATEGTRVVPAWKSFVACASYRDEGDSPSPCT